MNHTNYLNIEKDNFNREALLWYIFSYSFESDNKWTQYFETQKKLIRWKRVQAQASSPEHMKKSSRKKNTR